MKMIEKLSNIDEMAKFLNNLVQDCENCPCYLKNCDDNDTSINCNDKIKEFLNTEIIELKPQEKELLTKISDLCNTASDTVHDDDNTNGTAGILNLCDQLSDKINELLEVE